MISVKSSYINEFQMPPNTASRASAVIPSVSPSESTFVNKSIRIRMRPAAIKKEPLTGYIQKCLNSLRKSSCTLPAYMLLRKTLKLFTESYVVVFDRTIVMLSEYEMPGLSVCKYRNPPDLRKEGRDARSPYEKSSSVLPFLRFLSMRTVRYFILNIIRFPSGIS